MAPSHPPSSWGRPVRSLSGVLLAHCSAQGASGRPWHSSSLITVDKHEKKKTSTTNNNNSNDTFHGVKNEEDGYKFEWREETDGLLPGYQDFCRRLLFLSVFYLKIVYQENSANQPHLRWNEQQTHIGWSVVFRFNYQCCTLTLLEKSSEVEELGRSSSGRFFFFFDQSKVVRCHRHMFPPFSSYNYKTSVRSPSNTRPSLWNQHHIQVLFLLLLFLSESQIFYFF